MTLLITMAWRNLARHRRRTLITATAMAAAMGLCMSMLAFQEGTFSKLFEVMVEQQLGHAQLNHPEWPGKRILHDTLTGTGALLERLDAVEGLASAAPRLEGYALLGSDDRSAGALLIGLSPDRERRFSPRADRVERGQHLSQARTGGIVLGVGLAKELQVDVGSSVVAMTQSADGSLGNAIYEVLGVVRTGNAAVDRGGAMLHLADLQDLLVLPDQVHAIRLLSTDPEAIDVLVARVRTAVAQVATVSPWWELSPAAAQMMGMQDFAATLVLTIVFGAAGFGVLNTMMMSVFERTRELGLLKALGFRPARLVALILLESVLLAAIATALGLVFGGALDFWLVTVGIDLSGSLKDGVSFSGVVLDPVIKGVVDPWRVAQIVGALCTICVLASLWPALRASRLQPVAALRAD